MKKNKTTPPRLVLRLFRWFCHPKMQDYIEGDLMEVYEKRLKKSGKRVADIRFIIDVLFLFRPGIIRPAEGYKNLNNYAMIKNYFKIAWRNLWSSKGYSFINVAGLSTGMAVAMLICLWIWDELSFDSYFQHRHRLAQVMCLQTHEGITYTGGSIQMPLGDALRTDYASEFKAVSLTSWNADYILSTEEKNLSGVGMWVQHDFPEMFSLQMLSGRRSALKEPSSVLLCSSLATALFGSNNALNKTIRINNRMDMVVGGVYEDLPYNTTLHETQFLLPWDREENWQSAQNSNWMNHCGQLFVQLGDQADFNIVNEKVRNIPTPHIKEWKEEIMLHPMSKLHLYNQFENGKASGGRIQFVWLFGIIGVFILLLACINFMNLSTARSERRAKEVGVRKTLGSARGQLITQFLSESILIAGLAFILSLILVQAVLPFFNTLADKRIYIAWNNPVFWLVLSVFTLLTGIISGSYPAFYLSSFKPVKILKGALRAGRLATLPRKVLVVVQFTVSVTLIIGTLIVFQQIQYAKNRKTGFTREGLITIGINTPDLRQNVDVIKNELLQTGAIENMALASQSPVNFNNNNSIEWRGKDPEFIIFFRNVGVTPDFGRTIGWTMKTGRDFSADHPGDSSAMIVNERAAEIMGFEDPTGEVVKFHGKEFTIIGVAKDMLTQSPYEPTEPSFFITNDHMGLIVVRLNAGIPVGEALTNVESVFRKHNPRSPFEFNFVDEAYARKYASEERIGNLAALFAILAVFISCLGLFGLASFVAEQRTKEIGIRKVMGASVINLWKMLSKDFVMLTVISCCISVPLSFYFMNEWLMQYQYRTTLAWQIFALTFLGSLGITLLTVSFQAVRAASMNPVKSLRSE